MQTLRINGTEQGRARPVDVSGDMPLLWVLRDVVGLMGTKFGCGIAQCGACTVHINGQPVRSCVTPMRDVGDSAITTIDGMAATATGSALQRAWLALQVPQCGYCQSGQIMSAAALLAVVPKPTDAQIDAAMAGNNLPLLHVWTHPRRHQAGGRRHPRHGQRARHLRCPGRCLAVFCCARPPLPAARWSSASISRAQAAPRIRRRVRRSCRMPSSASNPVGR